MWHRWQRPVVRVDGDVVHAPSLAVPAVSGRPLVVTADDVAFHRFPAATTRRGRASRARPSTWRAANAAVVLAPSDFTRRELLSLDFRPEQVEVAYLGADPAPPVDDTDVDARLTAIRVLRPYILTVGTLEPRKRVRQLVTALGHLREHFPELELVVVGPVAGATSVGSMPLGCGYSVRCRGCWSTRCIGVHVCARSCRCTRFRAARGGGDEPLVPRGGRGSQHGSPRWWATPASSRHPTTPMPSPQRSEACSPTDARRAEYARRGLERAALFTWDLCVARHADVYRRALETSSS